VSDENTAAELPADMATEGTLIDLMGIVITEASPERVVATAKELLGRK